MSHSRRRSAPNRSLELLQQAPGPPFQPNNPLTRPADILSIIILVSLRSVP